MTFPTRAVSIKFTTPGGAPIAGVIATARLDREDRYQGFVIAAAVSATSDTTGLAVLNLFPNHPTTGLGTTGSVYTFTANPPGALPLNVQAQVPDNDCFLDTIVIDDQPAASLSTAQAAQAAAQASAGAAAVSAGIAQGSVGAAAASQVAAANSAAASSVSAGQSAGSAGAASGSAISAGNSAANAASSASSAATSAGNAAAAQGAATTQAGIATTKAGEAAASADTASVILSSTTDQAVIAATKADKAADSVVLAGNSASTAVQAVLAAQDQVALAAGQVANAAGYASNAQASAVDAAASAAGSRRILVGSFDPAALPTTRIDGSAVQDGDVCFGTNGLMYAHISGAWVNQTAAAAASATAASASAAGAAASAVAVAYIYPTPYSVAPTTRPDGSARVAGDSYFNSTSNLIFRWNGATWVSSDINTANLAASGGSALIGTLQAGTGAVTRTVHAKLNDTVDLRDFGPVADDATDDYLVFRAALNYCRDFGIGNLAVPSGKYYLGHELEIDCPVHIFGSQGYSFNFAANAPVLRFPKNTNGIRFAASTTSASGGRANDSTLEDVQLRVNDATAASGNGVHFDTRAKCVNVLVDGFGGDGFHIEATASGSPSKNANNWALERCKANNCFRDGLFIDGADVNAGYSIGFSATSCGRNGLYDSSFLGNTHIAPHTATNGLRHLVLGSDGTRYYCILDHVAAANTIPVTGADWATYWVVGVGGTTWPAAVIGQKYYGSPTVGLEGGRPYVTDDANAKCLFIGAYAESGQARNPYIVYPSQIIGGQIGTIDPEYGPTAPVRPNTRPIQAVSKDAAGDSVTSSLGGYRNSNLSALEWTAGGGSWRYDYDPANKVWSWWNGNVNNRAFRIQDTGCTLWPNLPLGTINFGLGVGIGGQRFQALSAVPGSGTYVQGDVVFNTALGDGKIIAWACSVGGAPGTWRPLLVAPSVSATKGNAGATLTAGSSDSTAVWDTALTADRAVALSITGAWNGAKLRIVRTANATGAFNLNVGTGPLKALAVGQWCDVEYNATAWMLTAFGSL